MNDVITAAVTGFHSKVTSEYLKDQITTGMADQNTKFDAFHAQVGRTISSYEDPHRTKKSIRIANEAMRASMAAIKGTFKPLDMLSDQLTKFRNDRLTRMIQHKQNLEQGSLSWNQVLDMVGVTIAGSAALGAYLHENTAKLIGSPDNKIIAPDSNKMIEPANQDIPPTPAKAPSEILKTLRIERGQSSLPQVKEPPKSRKRSKPNADIGFNNDNEEGNKDSKDDPKESTKPPDGTETPPGGDVSRGTGDDGGGNGEMFWTSPVVLDSGEPSKKKHKAAKKPKKAKKTTRFK